MPSQNAKSGRRVFQIIQGGLAQDNSRYEEKIEARLAHLSHSVEQFVESLPAALLAEQSATRELLEELVVKQSALQWIVRVAKHSEPGIGGRLWADIEQSLAGLEKMLEQLPRLQLMERNLRIASESERSAAGSRRS